MTTGAGQPQMATTALNHPANERVSGGPGAGVPPLVLFAAGWLLGVLCDLTVPATLTSSATADFRVVAALNLIVAGGVLFAWAMAVFARRRTGILLQKPARMVVTTGPYRWSRNPMYVGCVAIYLGASVLANTIWPLLLLPVVITLVQRLVIHREEAHMARQFGSTYQRYCRRVGRWL